jgi:hypothetical protein
MRSLLGWCLRVLILAALLGILYVVVTYLIFVFGLLFIILLFSLLP